MNIILSLIYIVDKRLIDLFKKLIKLSKLVEFNVKDFMINFNLKLL